MPFPLLIPLAMMAAGAFIDKDKPLRGAALGLGAGLTGGAALGAMGAAGAGTGAGLLGSTSLGGTMVGSGALAGEGAAAGSLLGGPSIGGSMVGSGALAETGAAAAEGGLLVGGEMAAETGLNSAGYLAPEMGTADVGGMVGAEQAPAELVNMNTQAGIFDTMNAQSNGMLGRGMDALNKSQKPLTAVMTGMNAAKMLAGPDQPMQAPQPPQMQSVKMDLSGLLGQGQQQQQYDEQANERRRQMMQMYASRMGGMG